MTRPRRGARPWSAPVDRRNPFGVASKMLRMAQRLFPDMQPPGQTPAETSQRRARGADVPVAPDLPRGKQLEPPKRLDPAAPQDPDVQLQAILLLANQTGRRVREV